MRYKILIFLLVLLISCKSSYVATQYSHQSKSIDTTAAADERIAAIIQPYKDSLAREMNVVLAIADDALTKSQPESDLGNFMCDVILKKSRDYCNCNIDFTFLNHGGIRLPNLPKGEITVGKMIELMPFENRLAVMELKGTTVDSLFDYMAKKGGWHISNARYKIRNGEAVEITIAGVPLNNDKVYTLAVSDYLAQGGDNCTMLKGIPYTDLKKTLREALIDGLKEMNTRGEHLKSVKDGRIQLVN